MMASHIKQAAPFRQFLDRTTQTFILALVLCSYFLGGSSRVLSQLSEGVNGQASALARNNESAGVSFYGTEQVVSTAGGSGPGEAASSMSKPVKDSSDSTDAKAARDITIQSDSSAASTVQPCHSEFDEVLNALHRSLQVNFTKDATENYLKLMLPLQLATASLCRVLLLMGSDQELLEICFQQVPRIDGETANLSLELQSRGISPENSLCRSGSPVCDSVRFGCGFCPAETDSPMVLALRNLSSVKLCNNRDGRSVDEDFACLYYNILRTQFQLSKAYIEIDQEGPKVSHIAFDALELFEDNPLYEWMMRRGLTCQGSVS
mmetsp:Transcript_9722/g.23341  ORF Transcript_9722/g.23341 Transcript_9722/m.23341 type:complete len:321 (+) Transcript_9722:493-1455(+)